MINHYDIIIIGAGHNGLVSAAYLAKQGKKVLVLERRSVVGGSVVTESFGEGFNVDSVWAGGSLRPDIIKELKLPLINQPEKPAFISLMKGSENLIIDADPFKAAEAIKRFSEKDAEQWPKFVAFMNKAAQFLDAAYATPMPKLPKNFSLKEGWGLAELGLELRLMGRKDMINLIRLLPMTAIEFVEEWFESEELKAAIASVAIHAVTLGPMSAGTGYSLLHNWLNRGGLAHSNVGKAGEITQALADAVKGFGGEIRTDSEVKQILVEKQQVKGVLLMNGEEIFAETVFSAVDPKHTFIKLVGPMQLPPDFVWQTQSIKMRGSLAKVHIHTNGKHGIPAGTVVLAPSLKYLEKAYDAAKYGEVSQHPYLEVTTFDNTVSIHFQFAPYGLKRGEWGNEINYVEQLAINTLAEYFPAFNASILNVKSISPLDLEQTYGLTEGDLNHGQLMMDQFFFMRPIPGWSNHKTPIDGLFLCGSGVHAGGGVSGLAGRNAARAWKRAG